MNLDLANFHMPRMHEKSKEYARIVHKIFYEVISMQEKCKNFAGMMHGSILLFRSNAWISAKSKKKVMHYVLHLSCIFRAIISVRVIKAAALLCKKSSYNYI